MTNLEFAKEMQGRTKAFALREELLRILSSSLTTAKKGSRNS